MYSMHRKGVAVLERNIICIASVHRKGVSVYTGEGYIIG